MTTELVPYTADQLALIKSQIAPKATDDELALFVKVCERTGLDPFSKQVYAIHRNVKVKDDRTGKWTDTPRMTIQVAIDGFRAIAERSGQFQGSTLAEWCGADGKWTDVWLADGNPSAARIGIWREGFREPLVRTALWKEYAQVYEGKPTGQWKTMPALMLAKCAEALALRAAFPNDLSGLYTSDEMSQADNSTTPAAPTQAAPTVPELPASGGEPVQTTSRRTVLAPGKKPDSPAPLEDPRPGYPPDPDAVDADGKNQEQRSKERAATGEQFIDDDATFMGLEPMMALWTEYKSLTDEQLLAISQAWLEASLPQLKSTKSRFTRPQYEAAMTLILDTKEETEVNNQGEQS